MKCPVCGEMTRPNERECTCGEVLFAWQNVSFYGDALRQHGLRQAQQQDYLGACLSFLVATASNPLETRNLPDAARALAHLGRFDDALRLAGLIPKSAEADQLLEAIQARKVLQARDAAFAAENPAETQPVSVKSVAPPPAPPPLPRPLLALDKLPLQAGFLSIVWPRMDQTTAALWNRVLEWEQSDPECGELPDWLVDQHQGATHIGHGVFEYARGLAAWGVHDDPKALASFRRCLEANPPFLNPAGYYLYLSLTDERNAKFAWDSLADERRDPGFKDLSKALDQRLIDFKAEPARKLLRWLRTGVPLTKPAPAAPTVPLVTKPEPPPAAPSPRPASATADPPVVPNPTPAESPEPATTRAGDPPAEPEAS